MESYIKKLYSLPKFAAFKSMLAKERGLHIKGAAGSFRALVAAYLRENLKKPTLYIANDQDSAERMRDDLEMILGRDKVYFLPAIEFEPYDQNEPSPSLLSMRMDSIQKMIEGSDWVIVATIEGILEYFPSPELFLDEQLYLKTGMNRDFESLIKQMNNIGFKRQDIVEQVGEFSVRGGLIDIYTWNSDEPFRLEFFGNEIESIRKFDVITQRTTGKIESISILPNLIIQENKALINDLLPDDVLLFSEDLQIIAEKAQKFHENAGRIYEENISEGISEESPQRRYLSPEKLEQLFASRSSLDTSLINTNDRASLDFKIKNHPNFNGSMKLFLQYLQKQAGRSDKPQLIIQAGNQGQADLLQEIIEEEDIIVNAKFTVGALHNGFIAEMQNIQILTDHEIFGRFKRRKTYTRFKTGAYLRQISSLNLYDYVVHIDYGIGQYMGMETLDYGGVKKECIKVAYRDGDSLFVTVDRLNRVQKFSSEEGGAPRLTKLGTTEWERTKSKTRESLKKIAAELIQVYAGRKAQGGYRFSADSHWQKELEASFIYEETEDQQCSIFEVKEDMEKNEPMDRLLCGDVGFGKTEVAIRAAFKAINDGCQAAVLVPTTILAFQHFETFKERLSEFPVNVEMLNRFRSAARQKKIIEELTAGKIDIIIGTHRLLSDDVRFKNLGLLIIDEEQRFGVRQKEKLKKYRLSVDILSMTATPIPRTMHMALMGARDLSNIDTPPRNRLPVHTEIMNWDDDKLSYIIMKEISRGGQVYFMHNRVQTINAVKEILGQIVPKARITVGHGQLPERQLEKVILDFMHKKYDVLVSTMIIENGLDIPNANTIIINRADKFGLAQLYQLRGRVGRSAQQAFAYLLVPPMEKITELARKRLRTIQDFTELGSGYKIALRDLEIRGAGNLLGREQSGYVQSVGFELYCKILDEAVNELKDETQRPEQEQAQHEIYTDPKVDVDFDLLIPADYIESELERITVYHRLVNFTSMDQIENLHLELQDRFGKLPEEVLRFLLAIEIKVLAGKLYTERLIIKDKQLKLIFSEKAQQDDRFFTNYIPALMNQKMSAVQFLNQKNPGVQLQLKGNDRIEKLNFAKKILENTLSNS